VFLDEPFTGLDPLGARSLCRALATLRSDGRTVVLTTHDLRQGLELSDRWLLLARGRIVDHGRSADTDAVAFEATYLERASSPRRGAA
jgi:ABC-2 type transport system ATP-binding protein